MADDGSIRATTPLAKFSDPKRTACGGVRAVAPFARLHTLWINTGTLCNIACANCYIESSPTNDRLVYITAREAAAHIDEAVAMGAREIAFTGGEPFMNPDIFAMIEQALGAGVSVLVLTNAMQPMMRPQVRDRLATLLATSGDQLTFRVSLDHFSETGHDGERGEGAFAIAMKGLHFLASLGARMSVAGRSALEDTESVARKGYAALFAREALAIDADDPGALVLFPEMEAAGDPPEITTACWSLLNRDPTDLMCASSRMLIKRRGAEKPVLAACTLIAYDEAFELGETLADAARPVPLNHRSCATFCVLGGASCSG